jgi:hypothetical protein
VVGLALEGGQGAVSAIANGTAAQGQRRTKPARPQDEAADIAGCQGITSEWMSVENPPPNVEGVVPVVSKEERMGDRKALDGQERPTKEAGRPQQRSTEGKNASGLLLGQWVLGGERTVAARWSP